jgi:DNA mismatch endonuclease (patch repair protein)
MGMSRSENMRRIRSKDTKPEIKVRSMVHRLGYRFRLHRKDLPGKPDLVFPSRKKVIFVHGCFWHSHDCTSVARTPKTNTAYWVEKIQRNTERDAQHQSALKALGWNVLVIWECELKDAEALSSRLTSFLE